MSVFNTDSKESYPRVANKIMRSEAVHMHGPEHHIIVGSALLTAIQKMRAAIWICPLALIAMETPRKKSFRRFLRTCGNLRSCCKFGMFLSIALKITNPLSEEAWGLWPPTHRKNTDPYRFIGDPAVVSVIHLFRCR